MDLDKLINEKSRKIFDIIELEISNTDFCNFTSFFPIQFWQKRGLILLLSHPNVSFTKLPDEFIENGKESLNKGEFLASLNPVTICNILEEENSEWLLFFIKEHFGKNVVLGNNLMRDPEFLGKLIKNKLAVLNHSSSSDLQARYILPVNTLFINVLKFPDKLEKVKIVFDKTQRNFFESYDLFEFFCYLEHYVTLDKDDTTLSRKCMAIYKTLTKLKEFELNNFDRNLITFNLKNLSQLKNQYLALKDE